MRGRSAERGLALLVARRVPFSILRTSGACDRAIIRRVHSSVGDAGGSSKLVPSQ
jgi:hypothetical protein